MKGPFKVIWKDWFGNEQSTYVYAQTKQEALDIFESEFKYWYELVDIYLDYHALFMRLKGDYSYEYSTN